METFDKLQDISSLLNKRLGRMSDDDFSSLAAFIKERYGLNLEGRKAMVESRLYNYVIDCGFESFSEYLNTVYSSGYSVEAANIINRLTTNYTYFFREQEHYEHFSQVFLPQLEKTIDNNEICVWSAGCSFGNEAYTFAICMEEYFGSRHQEWDKRLLATDISQNALIAAKKGIYSKNVLSSLPESWVRKYFTEKNGLYTVTDKLRSQVVFKYHNLMEPITFKKKFDLIICRNVMIYFDNPTKSQLLKRFSNALKPGGYLYIGHAEAMPDDCPFVRERAAVYRKLKGEGETHE